jgi:hypothetical protein
VAVDPLQKVGPGSFNLQGVLDKLSSPPASIRLGKLRVITIEQYRANPQLMVKGLSRSSISSA